MTMVSLVMVVRTSKETSRYNYKIQPIRPSSLEAPGDSVSSVMDDDAMFLMESMLMRNKRQNKNANKQSKN